MTILLHDGSNHGGLMDRLGAIGGALNDINAFAGGTATSDVLGNGLLPSRVSQFETYWNANTALPRALDGVFTSFLSSLQGSLSGGRSYLQSLAQQTLIQMANADTPLAQQTLSAALALLIQQMNGSGVGSVAKIAASSVGIGAQTAVGTPNGNAIVVLSKLNGQGLIFQMANPETLTFTCTRDSQAGATKGQESVAITGPAATYTPGASGPLDYLWPAGSGVSQTLTAVDAAQNNSGGTLLVNGELGTVNTANNPDNWTILVGAAGTDVFAAASGYADSTSLQFTGTGGALLDSVQQKLATASSTTAGAGGTPATLLPGTIYAVNCWVKCSATPAAGVLELALTDGANPGTIQTDPQGANLSFTKSLTAVSTAWVNVNGVFVTPLVMPSTLALRVRLSTAIDSGKSVFVDRIAMAPMASLYTGGPSCSIFSGSTKLILNDAWTVALTNTFGAFALLFERLFGMRSLGLQLPYSGSGTAISDGLVA